MPTTREHVRAARSQLDAAVAAEDADVTRPWAAVALFASAHQLVHALLDWDAAIGAELKHPDTQGGAHGTSTLVASRYRDIAIPYKSLFATANAVCHLGASVTSADFAGLRDDYEHIATWVRLRMVDDDELSVDLPFFVASAAEDRVGW